MISIYILILLSLLVAAGAFVLYLWAVRTGQFEDLEETKYQIFDEDDETGTGSHPETRQPKP